jgi:hypothetical protein
LVERRHREAAARLIRKRESDDRADALRCDRSERVGNARPPVVPHNRGVVEAEGVEQVDRVGSERNAASVSRRFRRPEAGCTGAAQRRHDRAPATFVQSPCDRPPPARRVWPAVQQEQRPTVGRPLLLELDLEDGCLDEAHGLPFYRPTAARRLVPAPGW